MPIIQPIVRCELDPTKPVPEICAVISALMQYHPGKEEEILKGVQEAVQRRLEELKGAEKIE